jgi:PAS domain S-box-containing protein
LGEIESLRELPVELDQVTGAIIEAVPDGIVVVDAEGRIAFVNAALEDLSDYRRTELIGTPVETLLPDGLLELVEPGHDRRLRRRRGDQVPIEVRLGRVDLGGVGHLLGAIRDVTARRDAEERLRGSEERLRALVEAAPVMVTTTAPNGLITSANRAFETMTGWRREDWVGKHFLGLIHPEDMPAGTARLDTVMQHGEAPVHEVRLRLASGGYGTFELSSMLSTRDGEAVEVVTTGRDVSERKRIEQALRESEERFRRIFDEGPLGIVLVDRDLRVTDANQRAVRMTGRSREEVIGSRFPAVTDPQEAAEDMEQMTRLLRGESEGYRIEKRFTDATGTTGYASITTSVIHDEHGTPLYTLRIVEDVTERRRLEREVASRAAAASGILARLTAREIEIMGLLTEGLSAPQMAKRLSVSTRTVESHLANAYRKLGVRSKEDAVAEFRGLSRAALASGSEAVPDGT